MILMMIAYWGELLADGIEVIIIIDSVKYIMRYALSYMSSESINLE